MNEIHIRQNSVLTLTSCRSPDETSLARLVWRAMQAFFRCFGGSAGTARFFRSSGARDSNPFAGLVFRFADRDCQDQKPEYGFRHDIGNGVTDLDSHDCRTPVRPMSGNRKTIG